MSPYWKYMLKSIGRTALAGFYGACTVLLIKQALEDRECAFDSRDKNKLVTWNIKVEGTPEEAAAVNKAASEAAHAKMLELMNATANAEKTTPKAGS